MLSASLLEREKRPYYKSIMWIGEREREKDIEKEREGILDSGSWSKARSPR